MYPSPFDFEQTSALSLLQSGELLRILSTGVCRVVFSASIYTEGIGEVDTEIVWNTVWTPERMSASAKAKLTLPMAQLLPLRQRRLEREAQASQQGIS